MSAETYSALEDAIRSHIADESETAGIVTDWYLVSAVEDMTEHRRRLLRDDDTDLD